MKIRVAVLAAEIREYARDYSNPEPGFGTPLEALREGFPEIPDLEVHYISCLRQPVKSPPKLAANIWYHALHVPKIGWMRTAYQGCIRATRKKLREIQPDIVHGQGTEHNNALCAVFSGFPNVITIHGNMRLIAKINHAKPFSFQWLAARLEAFTLPRSQGVVCITNYTREAVAGLARSTWLVPNAVDPGFFQLEPEPDLAEPPLILCVGNISVRKNQNNFIRMLDTLAARRPFKVVFLGGIQRDHPYGEEFLHLIASRPWCEFDGFADRVALKSYFRRATVLILPTLEDNCPMVVLEAMAAGLPVIASDVGGLPDLVEPAVTGLLCNPESPAEFTKALNTVLDDPGTARAMGERARQRALERFHPRFVAQRHLEIYREVLSHQRRETSPVSAA